MSQKHTCNFVENQAVMWPRHHGTMTHEDAGSINLASAVGSLGFLQVEMDVECFISVLFWSQ